MSFKKLLALLVLLGVLIAAGLVKKVYQTQQSISEENRLKSSSVVLNKDLATAFVTKIEITHGSDTKEAIILKKKEQDRWMVESHFGLPAKKYPVDQILKALTDLEGEIRSDSKDVLGDYSLTDDKAVHVRLYGDAANELCHLLVSPTRAASSKNFVRLSNSNQVLVTQGADLLGELGLWAKEDRLSAKTFVDFQVLKVDSSKVSRFEVMMSDKRRLGLRKIENKENKTTSWTFDPEDKSGEIDSSKVSDFFAKIANLYGTEVLDPKLVTDTFDETKPWIVLTLGEGKDAVSRTLLLGGRVDEKKAYHVKSMPDAFMHLVGDTWIEPLVKIDKSFFLKTPPAPSKS